MEGEVLTTWGVVLDVNGTDDAGHLESIGGWFAEARAAFFARCPRLAELLRSEDAILVVIAEDVGPIAFPTNAGALIGVSVVEIRRTSFDMAVRIRPAGRRWAPGKRALHDRHRGVRDGRPDSRSTRHP